MSKALQMLISKRERAEKVLFWKPVWLEKGGAKIVFNCIMPKPKADSSKIYIKYHGIASQKIDLYRSKCMKNGSQMKSFQSNVNTLVGGHIFSFLLVR